MKIGFHMQISKGFDSVLKEAKRMQCDVVQIFLKNPRSWAGKTFSADEIEAFKRFSGQIPVVGHLSYLPNLAKVDGDKQHLAGFLHEVRLCEILGIERLVVHPGSHQDSKKGIKAVAVAINRALADHEIKLLLENSAGQGASIGRDVEQIASIYEGVDRKENVFLCIDTAHLFASGVDIRKKSLWKAYIETIDKRLGKGKIGFFHLNDSKTSAGSRVDRHWHIGKGEIGAAFFRSLVNDKRFAHLEGVMETPKMGNMDEENMRTMRSLLSPLVSRSSF